MGRRRVIVNQAFARSYYADGALGSRLALTTGAHQEWREIVGVVPDLGMGENTRRRGSDAIYLPMAQLPAANLRMLAHASGPPLNLSGLRCAMRCAPTIPTCRCSTSRPSGEFEQNTWPFRVFGTLFLAFGFAALFLATVGPLRGDGVLGQPADAGDRHAHGVGAQSSTS